jgi:hypothetical protein
MCVTGLAVPLTFGFFSVPALLFPGISFTCLSPFSNSQLIAGRSDMSQVLTSQSQDHLAVMWKYRVRNVNYFNHLYSR